MTHPRSCVVLDRVDLAATPPYCTHGKATCIGCGTWVWLGSETYGPVASRAVDPICKACAERFIAPATKLVGHLADHRRADGPHL